VKILNKLDTTKGIALVGFLVVLAILVGVVSSGTMFGPVFYGIAAAGLVFQLFLVFRGTGRRIHTVKLQNERLEKELELAKGLLQTVEHASNANVKNAESLMGSVRTINNIAGSVSKARAVQAGMQNVVNEISNVVLTHSGAAPKKRVSPATPEPALPATPKGSESSQQESRESSFGKEWQLKKNLILPYAAKLENDQFFRAQVPLLSQLRAAVILDPFSWGSIAPELDARPVTPTNWFEVFEEFQPEVFLCESAWQGVPGESKPWKARVYGSKNFSYENRAELFAILEYCEQHYIPTIFWNKEDPTHFTDRVNDFVDTAKRFDYIFTTAAEMVPNYVERTGKNNAACMPFAVQPRIFNALDRARQGETDDVIFAGSWYKTHSERQEVQAEILDGIVSAGYDLRIYDRYSGKSTEQFGYPERYSKYINPAVPFEKTADLYRANRYGISINTVTTSPTMLARRAFEMVAAGCTVITNRTQATEFFFGERILQLDRHEKITREKMESATESRLELLNRVLAHDTYEARLSQAMKHVGLNLAANSHGVTVLLRVSRLHEIEDAVRRSQGLSELVRQVVVLVDKNVEPHMVQEFYKHATLTGASAVSEKYWRENGIDPQTVFEWPSVFVSNPAAIRETNGESLKRALNHLVYSPNPVVAEEQQSWPQTKLREQGVNCVMWAKDATYLIEHGFEAGVVTVV